MVQEYQCCPHSSDYALRGLAPLRIWADYDPATQRIVAVHTHIVVYENKRTIYLDGRPRPSDYAPHTFQGFSTGVWEGNMLTVTTTHLKENYLRRNGVPRSSKAMFTEHWTMHGNYLTITHVVDDPVILTEPLVRSQSWFLDPGQRAGLFPASTYRKCRRKLARFRTISRYESLAQGIRRVVRAAGRSDTGWRRDAVSEYRSKLGTYKPKDKCERFCNCTGFGDCLSPFGR